MILRSVISPFGLKVISGGGGGYNPLTTAWIAETGETDLTIIEALNTFEQGLIDNSLLTKFKAIYPFVGGSATLHKYNFMDARDDNSAFRILFNGGFTHAATGVTGNGTNNEANTNLNMLSELGQNDTHLCVYSRTVAVDVADIGTISAAGYRSYVFPNLSGSSYAQLNSSAAASGTAATTTRTHIVTRTAVGTANYYRDGSLVYSDGVASDGLPDSSVYITCINNQASTINYYSAKEYCFASIGYGLTAGQVTTFTNLINTLQTSLSRSV